MLTVVQVRDMHCGLEGGKIAHLWTCKHVLGAPQF